MKTIVAILICILSQTAHAGREGHGGDGVWEQKKLELLDFNESGISNSLYFKEYNKVSTHYFSAVEAAFPKQSRAFHFRLASKIQELSQVSQGLGAVILRSIQLMSFQFVKKELLNVKDERTPLKNQCENCVQLAVRRGMSVLIDETLWTKLPLDHQVGLITHEISLAFEKPGLEPESQNRIQNSFSARRLNVAFYQKQSMNSLAMFEALAKGSNGLYEAIHASKIYGEQKIGTNATIDGAIAVGVVSQTLAAFVDHSGRGLTYQRGRIAQVDYFHWKGVYFDDQKKLDRLIQFRTMRKYSGMLKQELILVLQINEDSLESRVNEFTCNFKDYIGVHYMPTIAKTLLSIDKVELETTSCEKVSSLEKFISSNRL